MAISVMKCISYGSTEESQGDVRRGCETVPYLKVPYRPGHMCKIVGDAPARGFTIIKQPVSCGKINTVYRLIIRSRLGIWIER